ncbi:MAG TPA: P-loop NTPase fold protein [Pirellulaceae bacterium]|jgi:hypothetical protein|nr:P-loop NTPase fold protein [Pirellulaceae bacterium]
MNDVLKRMIRRAIWRWMKWWLLVTLCILVGVLLLPAARLYPSQLHEYVSGLGTPVTQLFIVAASFTLAYGLARLSLPRLAHIQNFHTHPPAWSAFAISAAFIAYLDLRPQYSLGTYEATREEWLLYAAGAAVLAIVVLRAREGLVVGKAAKAHDEARSSALEDWQSFREWLRTEAPARFDYFDSMEFANRITRGLAAGRRSFGVIGPFGAGKSSIINWIEDAIRSDPELRRRYLIVKHNSWGFESASAAVGSMLTSALEKAGERIDTFEIGSLPEAYRRTFSPAGGFADTVTQVLFQRTDPVTELRQLSDALADVDANLLLIVEDLDRNDSQNFDVQEVLGFLHQLRSVERLNFILTGGIGRGNTIDFARLCDHCEYVASLEEEAASHLIIAFRQQCTSQSNYQYEEIDPDQLSYHWTSSPGGGLLSGFREMTVLQAMVLILTTPRAFRHALGRTFLSWESVYGEVSWDQLLALNVLRVGAPRHFDFIESRYARLHEPIDGRSSSTDRHAGIRASVQRAWQDVTAESDVSEAAVMMLVEFLLPAAPWWLSSDHRASSSNRLSQGVYRQRYWRRAVEGRVRNLDVRDQVVIANTREWIAAPDGQSDMISRICDPLPAYRDTWETFATRFFLDQPQLARLASEQIVSNVAETLGASAGDRAAGFAVAFRLAQFFVGPLEDNIAWLNGMVERMSRTSLSLSNSLVHYYTGDTIYAIAREEEQRHGLIAGYLQSIRTSTTVPADFTSVAT